ncbi:MAG TPA: Uma2 family endonuclease [Leptolyngbyaceae cyanobacterium M33_DOE_097]|uniref:Uma2 family endonuclease n=1 Tax=Oscillatoriales cyanobacterium SpSt-418 TaxID=2282169 RepID=A0A7C3PFP1_9CYAN|nr:Uma2 family endonuclease [Leptolyngbyaceae cyanobacterium M33_DOE_097]
MTQAKMRFTTLEEYAAVDSSELPEGNYELVNGAIVEMGAENLQNVEIASFLFSVLLQFVPYYLLHRGTEIAVSSRLVTSRFPDLMVLTEKTRAAMNRGQRSLITLEMPAPRLVIEVVSPGEPGSDNYDRDYIEKRQEYAKRGIPEFWLVDPVREVVLVLSLVDSTYKAVEFRGSDCIQSPTFKALNLTAHQILAAGEEP